MTYRQAIQTVFDHRMRLNPQYSLRAFARDLGLSPGFLSQVLKEQRGLTAKKATEVFNRLGLAANEKKLYLLEVQKGQHRSVAKKAIVQKKIDSAIQQNNAHTLAQEEFQKITHWYALALLQLLRVKDSPRKNKSKWCIWAAKKLNIQVSLVRSTLETMIEMKLIREEKGMLNAVHDTVWTTHQAPSTAIRIFHKQMISKAQTAIEMQSIEERFLQSLQFPVLKSDLPQIQKEIVKFRNQMLRKYGRTATGDADTVYGLNMQLFKLLED